MKKIIFIIGVIVLVCAVAFTVFYFNGGKQLLCKHSNQRLDSAKAAVCEEAGYTGDTYCTDCGKLLQQGEEIPALEHQPVVKDAVEVTCTEDGYTGDTICTVCDAVLKANEKIPAKGHTEVTEGKLDATCTEAGSTGKTLCSDCGVVLKESETIEALGHKEVTENYKASTCTTDGYTGDTKCSVCNAELSKGNTIPAAHDVVTKNQKDATCTAEGYSGDKSCKVCGVEISKGKVLEKTAHNEETKNQKDATCTAEGYTGDTYCTDCKATLSTGEVIPATNHSNTYIENKKFATQTEEGYTGDTYCKDCGKLIEKGKKIDKYPTVPDYKCLSSWDKKVFDQMNEERAKAGLPALKFDTSIHAAPHLRVCEYIYRELNNLDTPAHARLDGAGWDTALDDTVGYSFYTCSEIIAACTNAEDLVPGWMGSDGHRGAILDEEWTHVSLCVVYTNYTYYSVAIFHNDAKLIGTIIDR